MNTLNRGDIVRVDFPDEDDIPSSEFDSPHPAVIVQNDTANNQLETATVVPVTTSGYEGNNYEVRLFPDRDGVEEESVAKANLIATVSIRDRIINEREWKMGEISPKKMDEL